MISTVQLTPPTPLRCGDYELDRFVIELDEDDLDFRLQLGLSLGIYWALPAGPNDRLRLALVDGAAFEVSEPVLEADPFVFDLPRTEWHGELGALHDGSQVVRVVFEASRSTSSYRCEIQRRIADGSTLTLVLAHPPPLTLTPALERALSEGVPTLAAWDRQRGAVLLVSIAPGFPAQVTEVARFEGAARTAFEALARTRGITLGAAWAEARVFWVIDETRCQIWHEGERCCLERRGDSLVLADGTVDLRRVRAVLGFRDPGRRNHRGLALKLEDESLVRVVEHADTDYAPRIDTLPERDWNGILGHELARALGVEWAFDPRTDLTFASVAHARPRAESSSKAPAPTLLDACRASPDDDVPRLAWAHEVGGERGELVVLQCELARGGLTAREAVQRRRRVRELLDQHGAKWSGLDGIAHAVHFERGFVDAAMVPADAWFARGDAIRDRAPLLTALTPTGLDGYADDGSAERALLARVDTFLADPALRDIAALKMSVSLEVYDDDGPNWYQSLNNAVVPRLVDAGLTSHLRGLGIGGIESDGMRSLKTCDLRNVEVLQVGCSSASESDWLELLDAGRMPRLRALRIALPSSRSLTLARLLDALSPRVVDLWFATLTTRELGVLAEHPIASRLERLGVGDCGLGNTHLFAAFPRLRSLDVSSASGHFVEELSAATMPALRELAYFGTTLKPELSHIAALVERLGSTLELLELQGLNAYGSIGSDAHVAAELARITRDMPGVVLGPGSPSRPELMHLGAREAPYWATVALRS